MLPVSVAGADMHLPSALLPQAEPLEPAVKPSEAVADRVAFCINNLSEDNLEKMAAEIRLKVGCTAGVVQCSRSHAARSYRWAALLLQRQIRWSGNMLCLLTSVNLINAVLQMWRVPLPPCRCSPPSSPGSATM